MIQNRCIQILLISGLLLLSGCASMMTGRLAENLSNAMLNQTDPETVRAGAPAYLLFVDSLIADSPKDEGLLMAGSRLYGAYGGTLVTDPDRRKRLTAKALTYAENAFCPNNPKVCELKQGAFADLAQAVANIDMDQKEHLYVYATAWAGWIQARSDDWNAIADLPKAELLLQHLVTLDPTHENGRAQLYLAVIRSQLPPALGGKPEQGKRHFELAIDYSEGRDLIAKVEFARYYARLVFDQELHDRLLKEVLEADPDQPGLTLSNVIAQQRAKTLLTDEYF